MKKRIAVLLAGIMCLGMLAACDDDGEYSGSEPLVSTETGYGDKENDTRKVTDAQWTASFTAPDLTDFVYEIENTYTNKETGVLKFSTKKKDTFNGNKYKSDSRNGHSSSEGSYVEEKATRYVTEINGVVYACEHSYADVEEVWQWKIEPDNTYFSDLKYNTATTLDAFAEDAKQQGKGYYMYDKENGWYYSEMTTAQMSSRQEIEFRDGVLYAVRQFTQMEYMYDGELCIVVVKQSYTFTAEEVTLPEIEKLNALMAAQ